MYLARWLATRPAFVPLCFDQGLESYNDNNGERSPPKLQNAHFKSNVRFYHVLMYYSRCDKKTFTNARIIPPRDSKDLFICHHAFLMNTDKSGQKSGLTLEKKKPRTERTEQSTATEKS